jgi:four helix bundle protein
VWQTAFEAALEIFAITRRFPGEERYSLTDQIRRSSRSVPSNIAEAWRKRRYPASFVSKLSDAEGEAAETETWLDFSLRCGYLRRDEYDRLIDQYEHIAAQLVLMSQRPQDWTVPNSVATPISRRRALAPSPRLSPDGEGGRQ